MDRILVLGDGGWGTALAQVLDERGVHVTIWCHDAEYAEELARTRRNARYLPGVPLAERLAFTSDPQSAKGCPIVFSVVPSAYLRSVASTFRDSISPSAVLVSCTKGIEFDTRARPSEILAQELPGRRQVVLSGPSHAEEVARRMPTTVVAASADGGLALTVQDLLTTDRFRVYTNADPIGVEVAGAVKNVLAIASGAVDGLGFGDNTKAALLTRGIVEMARFGEMLGAKRDTFWGLAGIGDLVTSCISQHGRNRAVGERVGRGEKIGDVIDSMRQVAEGVRTAKALHDLAAERAVEMPICNEVYRVIYEEKDPARALRDLMTRQLKEEAEW